MIVFIIKGYGLIGLPLFLIRGKRSARLQQESIEQKLTTVQSEIQAIKTKVNLLEIFNNNKYRFS